MSDGSENLTSKLPEETSAEELAQAAAQAAELSGSKSAGTSAIRESEIDHDRLWRLAQAEIRETDSALALAREECFILIGMVIGISLALWLVLLFHRSAN